MSDSVIIFQKKNSNGKKLNISLSVPYWIYAVLSITVSVLSDKISFSDNVGCNYTIDTTVRGQPKQGDDRIITISHDLCNFTTSI